MTRPSPWPYRLALWSLWSSVPLVLLGGGVTSIEAGMAIDGWLILEPGRGDHFLLAYPVDKWFRDAGTFLEHTHRLFGILVGLLCIGTVISSLVTRVRPGTRTWALVALVAVSAQGVLGGTRVLENSPQLAFLHGAFAQIVLALLALAAAFMRPQAGPRMPGASALRKRAWMATGALYVTIFAGAYLRHTASHIGLAVHLLGIFASAGLVVGMASQLKQARNAAPEDRDLRRMFMWTHALLGVQILLGMGSFWIVYMAVGPTVTEVHQSIFPTLHVLFGALLLAHVATVGLRAQQAEEAEAGA